MSYPARIYKGQLQVKTGTRWRKAVERECVVCFNTFYVPAEELRRHNSNNQYATHCTPSCAGKSNAKRLAGNRVVKLCVICREPFSVAPSKANRYSTCSSDKCRSEYRRQVTTARHRRRQGVIK